MSLIDTQCSSRRRSSSSCMDLSLAEENIITFTSMKIKSSFSIMKKMKGKCKTKSFSIDSFASMKLDLIEANSTSTDSKIIEEKEELMMSQLKEKYEIVIKTLETYDIISQVFHRLLKDEKPCKKQIRVLSKFLSIMNQNYMTCLEAQDSDYEEYVFRGLEIIKPLIYLCSQLEEYNNSLDQVKIKSNKLPLKQEFDSKKPNLVFDMDETLLRAEERVTGKKYDYVLEEANLGILVRPHIKDVLNELGKDFNLFLFSAGSEAYVHSVIQTTKLDLFFLRIYDRQHCIPAHSLYIKDLSLIPNYKEGNTLIVENNIFSFTNNIDEGILLNSYYGHLEENEDPDLLDMKEMVVDMLDDYEEENLKVQNRKFFMYSDILHQIKRDD